MARRPTDPKITIIGIPTNSSGNIDGVSRGPSAPRKKTVTRFCLIHLLHIIHLLHKTFISVM
jgi:hypothetical protein